MKKVIAFFAMAIVATVFSVEAKSQECPPDAQYIITDCGTVHQIPTSSSEDFACVMVDFWTGVDC